MGVLQKLRPGDFHVTVVSSDTFTTFTPLLPCKYSLFTDATVDSSSLFGYIAAAVGTVQVRSLIEPIRKIIARLRGHYVQGKAIDIDMKGRLLEVEIVTDGKRDHIYIPYVDNCISRAMNS